MQYRTEIDGLRAIAVVPVILFHAGFSTFSGGYVGVDVFFVISGYLICSIIIEDLEKDRFSILHFYERRARRILPALFFMLLFLSIFFFFRMLPTQFSDFSEALISTIFFSSNFLFWRQSSYFDPLSEENPLLHTWSLAVEEQFYLAFPIAMMLIWRRNREAALSLIVLVSVASLIFAEMRWRQSPTANFYLIPSRIWELGAGAICAVVIHRGFHRESAVLSGTGLALILFAVFWYDEATPFPSLYALAPVSGAALIIVFGSARTPVARLLSSRALVGIGLISFSLYLWHQPLFAAARIVSPSPPERWVMVGLIFCALVIAYVSWRFIETPFRRRRRPLLSARARLFAVSGLVSTAFVAFGAYGVMSNGRYDLWARQNPETAVLFNIINDAQRINGVFLDNGDCRFNTAQMSESVSTRLLECFEKYGPAFAIIGDSHAIDVFNGVDSNYGGDFLFGMTSGNCRASKIKPQCGYDLFAKFVSSKPDVFYTIVYHQSGLNFVSRNDGVNGRAMISSVPEYGDLDIDAYSIREDDIEAVKTYLESLDATTAKIIWAGPWIEPHIGQNYILKAGCENDFSLREGTEYLFMRVDKEIERAMSDSTVTFSSIIDPMDMDMANDFIRCPILYWRDADHLSLEGAKMFVERLVVAGAFGALRR